MDLAFYTAAAGASAQQKRLNIVANNLANLSTVGFKKENAVFANLIYNELNPPAQEGAQLSATSGARVEKTNTDFTQAEWIPTNMPYDFAVAGEGFFALQDPATGQISYTRDGTFSLSQQADGRFLLTAQNGKHVLDTQGEVIAVDPNAAEVLPVGVYCFRTNEGMLHIGGNEYLPTEKNGAAIPMENSNALLLQGYTENSNVFMAEEFEKIIEAQRAYQYVLKMVQTSDEIESTINNLRG